MIVFSKIANHRTDTFSPNGGKGWDEGEPFGRALLGGVHLILSDRYVVIQTRCVIWHFISFVSQICVSSACRAEALAKAGAHLWLNVDSSAIKANQAHSSQIKTPPGGLKNSPFSPISKTQVITGKQFK
jgi:hypothetical protein